MVRLKERLLYEENSADPGFNSTMVRLKGFIRTKSWEVETAFQFHNGSIKRQHETISIKGDAEFQFHNGSIKSSTC